MAIHQMKLICAELVQKYDSVRGIVIYHRIGEVPAGECSVLIVVASPHRQHALQAVAEAIDLVKGKVPIWKKEFYEGEEEATAAWKANPEFTTMLQPNDRNEPVAEPMS